MKHRYLMALLFSGFLMFGLVWQTRPTNALQGSDFNPGRIIDNEVFYNKSSMTTGQIQAFLNSKMPVCDTNGTKPYNSTQTRAQRGAAKGYPPPYTCLKDYKQNVPNVINGGSDLCKNSISAGYKSAAQIIKDVANACGINPQVLIVMLQKEQGLVTDDWPWSIQYKKAMGYGCPDTAPCDLAYFGFFNQVYNAAKAFNRYQANPTWYNYRVNRNNYILYNPNTNCGGKTVFIENQATANLYIYTPYQPNQAALNNLYGTGNSCSAYGNRNFWRLFNDWFGSTFVNSLSISSQLRIYDNNNQEVTDGKLYRGTTYKLKYKIKNNSTQQSRLGRHGVTAFDGSKYSTVGQWRNPVNLSPGQEYQFSGNYTPTKNKNLKMYINYYDEQLSTWMGAYKIPLENNSIKRIIEAQTID